MSFAYTIRYIRLGTEIHTLGLPNLYQNFPEGAKVIYNSPMIAGRVTAAFLNVARNGTIISF
ncbi:hypothetical protein Ga0466249_003791 [Sporomusaceae bacterium BoRhaA]|uniref:hypothetical protein n=1 Tax=Pelorhabdus rhamnosifermentans TaxID=2772457 RepID=UPI001C063780|nr:hypothetical protein [Pelorhabdus rhamnosifermentans]MBU2702656.1 hypothetical protein [Pelorhabdus rhamnosifermentans]